MPARIDAAHAVLVRESPVDAEAIASSYPVSQSTIRSWAHRGLLTKYPQGHRRRTLYSLAEFARVFTERTACRTDPSRRGVQH